MQAIYTSRFIYSVFNTAPPLRPRVDLQKVAHALSHIPAMQQLTLPELQEVAESAMAQKLPPGGLIMRQGDHGDSMCVILEGEGHVYCHSPDALAVHQRDASWGKVAQEAVDLRTLREVRPTMDSRVFFLLTSTTSDTKIEAFRSGLPPCAALSGESSVAPSFGSASGASVCVPVLHSQGGVLLP